MDIERYLRESDSGPVNPPHRSEIQRGIRVHRSGMLRLNSLYEADTEFTGDESLSLIHRALSRFHDETYDALLVEDPSERYLEARRQTCFLYQWIVLNELMPALCAPSIIVRVMEQDAPIYQNFLKENPELVSLQSRPIPFEFAIAVLRFVELCGRRSISQEEGKEWPEEPLGQSERQRLCRELMLGYALDLPSAQSIISEIKAIDLNAKFDGMPGASFPQTAKPGELGKLIRSSCPLLFYLYLEAGLKQGDWLFGPLGGRIAAEILVGILVSDPMSFWNASGSGYRGRWSPEDGVDLGGGPVTNCSVLLERFGH